MTTKHVTSRPSAARRSSVRRIAALTCVLACGLGVGAAQAQPTSTSNAHTVPAQQDVAFKGPPPVRLIGDAATLLLRPYRACWSGAHGGVCYDGFPPQPLASLGGTSRPVHLAFTATVGTSTSLRLTPAVTAARSDWSAPVLGSGGSTCRSSPTVATASTSSARDRKEMSSLPAPSR